MTTPPFNPYQQRQMLTRFIRRVGKCSDTPSLILLIAANADYMQLCLSIVDPASKFDPVFADRLKGACRDIGMNPHCLKETLTPAVRALGLVPSSDSSLDYYHLLGVRSRANAREIKKAFRTKAAKIHPDANTNPKDGSRPFVELNEAYQTLRNPALRHQYDAKRRHLMRWREHPGLSMPVDNRPPIFFWYFYGLLFTFLILLLILNWIVF